jgi:YggT family protein
MLGPATGIAILLINLFILLLIGRAVLSWVPELAYTEIGRMIVTATEWYLAPIRRVIPPVGAIDVSFIVGILLLYLLAALIGSGSIIGTLVSVISSVLIFLVILLVIRIIFGFFRMDPWHPISQMIMAVTDPLVAPFRSWIRKPRYGQFDWAPIAATVALLVVWYLITNLATFGVRF